ncbi:MAG: hypothetical protein ACI9FR_002958 [Cryomorphaceae bacterium]|jgi:uncharacterized protein (DUF1499 family)
MGAWLKRLSILAVLGFPITVIGSRLGFYDFRIGFSILTYTVYLAAAVFLVGLIVIFVQRKSNQAGSAAARTAVLLALIPLAIIGNTLVNIRSVPAIHNISTDTINPPQFQKIIELRGEGTNPLEYDASSLAEVQLKAYPEVQTLMTSDTPEQAHAKALSVVAELGWELVNDDVSKGIIEATETTALWAFKDDVVIRITQQGEQTAIDLRSVSRVGQSDIGANAKRIKKFLSNYSS